MKKIIALALALVLCFALVACGGSSSDEASLTIAVPNDTTNEARALLLLQELGYITVDPNAGITATIGDIT